jgi:hypothetical protein
MSSAPAEHAVIVSAVNNDLARFGSLLAVAVLTAGITGTAFWRLGALAEGFRTAVLISGQICVASGWSPRSRSPTPTEGGAQLGPVPGNARTTALMRHQRPPELANAWARRLAPAGS